jgi:hypothetical protein
MFIGDEEKDKVTKELSDQYSQNIINMDEYERLLEYINKTETKKELTIIEKIIHENTVKNNEIIIEKSNEKNLSMFSWRTSNVKSLNGNGGKYISLFGANQLIVENLPKGRTILKINSIFGLIEIIVSKNIKIINKTVPIFSGIFQSQPTDEKADDDSPELYITGKAIFGNITIKRIEVLEKYNELNKKITEKIYRKI